MNRIQAGATVTLDRKTAVDLYPKPTVVTPPLVVEEVNAKGDPEALRVTWTPTVGKFQPGSIGTVLELREDLGATFAKVFVGTTVGWLDTTLLRPVE